MNLMPAVADCHFQGWFHPHILIMDIVPLPTRNWGGGVLSSPLCTWWACDYDAGVGHKRQCNFQLAFPGSLTWGSCRQPHGMATAEVLATDLADCQR